MDIDLKTCGRGTLHRLAGCGLSAVEHLGLEVDCAPIDVSAGVMRLQALRGQMKNDRGYTAQLERMVLRAAQRGEA